jgi:cytoskeleton protein RodZ
MDEMTELDSTPPDNQLSIGEQLRRERELRGISLREIADSTKIGKRFLEAIERNDLSTLPAPVFTRGFVREYARYLGLDADEMVDRYMELVEVAEAEAQAAMPVASRTPPVPRRKSASTVPPERVPAEPKKWLPAALLILGLALIAVAVWYFVAGRAPEQTVSEPIPQPTSEELAEREAALDAAPPPEPEGLQMTLSAAESSWVVLEADGEIVINQSLPAGSERRVEASERFVFRTIGNAGGLRLNINGVEVPPLGQSGDVVRNRVFDRQALETLRGGTAPAPATAPRP